MNYNYFIEVNHTTGKMMAKLLPKKEMIDFLNEKYSNIGAADASDFYGREANGIWLRGTESQIINGHRVYDEDMFFKEGGVNPELEALLKEHGWYGEPYDSGTLFAWEA